MSAADLWQRLGRLEPEVARLAGQRAIWLHAASVGEVLSAEPLVERLRRDEPERPLLATTTSLTGRAAARERLGLPATLLPIDLPPIVRPAMRRLDPAALVILETEIWPGLIAAAAQIGAPVLIVSARMSARSLRGYARIRGFFRRALERVAMIAAQTTADAERFIALGAAPEKVVVLGSLKLARRASDSQVRACAVDLGDRDVLVAASTQPGEEAAILEACAPLWQRFPRLLLVLAPRRPERFDEVAAMLARAGLRSLRRSSGATSVPSETQVFLLDTVGELATYFPAARAAFVGGTLAPLGGHNVLEPAGFGVPVVYGPNLDNVRPAVELLESAGAGSQVANAAELGRFWQEMLADPEAARARGERGRSELEARGRVADEVADLVRRHLRRN